MVRVSDVERLESFSVRLRFTDGTIKDVDLRPYLRGPCSSPCSGIQKRFDPVLRALMDAAVDDELEFDEEKAAAAEGMAALASGDVVSDQELRSELGL